MHFGAVGWQPTALKSNHGLETRGFGGGFGGYLRHFGAVGWQPTALKSNHGVLKHQAWRELDAFWGCRLATYST